MQQSYKKLQIYEKLLFLQSCVVAEYYTTSKNDLNKQIREYIVAHIQLPELVY
jgi:hypothetical protein